MAEILCNWTAYGIGLVSGASGSCYSSRFPHFDPWFGLGGACYSPLGYERPPDLVIAGESRLAPSLASLGETTQ